MNRIRCTGRTLTIRLVALAMTVAAPSAVTAQARHQLLVVSGDPIPSRTTTFTELDRIRMLDSGDVSFTAGSGVGDGVFLASASPDGSSTVTPVLQAGDPAGWMGSPMSVVRGAPTFPVSFSRSRFVYDVNASGAFAIGADIQATPTGGDQTLGLFRVTSPGTYELITDGRELTIPRASGGNTMDDLDGHVLEAVINASGDILFLMGPFSRFGTGLFLLSGTTFRNVAFPDDPVLINPTTLGAPPMGRRDIRDIHLTDTGTVMFLTDDGFGPVALWRERAGTVELVLVEGPAPMLVDETISEIREVVVGPTGRYIVDCDLEPGGKALYGGSDDQALDLFVEADPRGEAVTTRAGGTVIITGYQDLFVEPAGNYFFTAAATLDDGSRADGIWRRTGSDGTLALFIHDRFVPAPGVDALVNPVIQSINLGRDVVFAATQGSPPRSSIWIRRGVDYSPLVTEGDVIEGLEVTNARGDRPVVRASLSDAGLVALRLGVDVAGTPGEALFYSVPGEITPPEANANLGFLEAESEVTFDAERITFRMLVFNDGPEDVTPGFSIDVQATGMNLSDPRIVFSAEAGAIVGPDEVSLAPSSPVSASCIPTNETATALDALCDLSTDFAADGSRARSVDISFAYNGAGPYGATFTLRSPLMDPEPSDDQRTDSVELVGANLAIDVSAFGHDVWEVRNGGPEVALNVRFAIEDTRDNALTVELLTPTPDPADPGAACGRDSGLYFCDVDRLEVGESMTVRVATGANCYEHAGSAFAETMDPDESNNVAVTSNEGTERCSAARSECAVGWGRPTRPVTAFLALVAVCMLRRRRHRP